MNERSTLAGAKVLVTGGSRGIGRAVVLAFARAGAEIAFSYRRDSETARSTAHEVAALGRQAYHRASDAADPTEAARFVRDAADALGGLDVVVPNAGIAPTTGFEGVEPARWAELSSTLLVGPYATVDAARPYLRSSRGSVVLVGSIAGLRAYPEELPYSAAKAGLLSLARSLGLAYAPEVRVNAVAPGWVHSDMTRTLYDSPRGRAAIERTTPRGRWGEPEDVAAAVLFLASEGARFITGETLVVDGGEQLAWRVGMLR